MMTQTRSTNDSFHRTMATFESGKAPPGYLRDACQWITDNPKAWRWLRGMGLKLANRKRRFGMKALVERLRWEVSYEWNLGDFKCNNNLTAPLALLLIAQHPDIEPWLETRKRKTL